MILRGNQARFHRWCLDSYGNPRPIRWLKDRLLRATMRHYERHLPILW
jgi:hypothetical protein